MKGQYGYGKHETNACDKVASLLLIIISNLFVVNVAYSKLEETTS